jgi:hypothetical protein
MGRTAAGLLLAAGLAVASPRALLPLSASNGPPRLDRAVLGASLFRAAWAYRHDRAWLEDQLALLAEHDFDAIRVLGQVGDPAAPDFWDGREIDWRWPDYESVIAGLTDLAYDRYGLRVQWTIFAGAPLADSSARDQVVDRFLQMSRGRERKILAFEIANEYFNNAFPGPDGLAELTRLARQMKEATTIPIAASSHSPDLCALYASAAVDLATFHFDRSRRDPPSAMISESGCTTLPPILSNNEPIGPGSSVESESDPYRIVAAAVGTYLAGMPIYIFHTGPGVRDDPYHPLGLRPSRLQDLPGINRIIGGLYAMKGYLPADVHLWTRQRADDPLHPFSIEGPVRSVETASRDARSVVLLAEINGPLVLTARREMNVEVIDPPTGEVRVRARLAKGDRLSLEPLPAYVVIAN